MTIPKFHAAMAAVDEAGNNAEAGKNYMWMLYALAHSSASYIGAILEIGAGPDGTSGLTFAYALSEYGGATPKLFSIDINPEHPVVAVRDFVSEGLKVDWRIIIGDSLKVSLDQLPDEVDMLYIDGDHGGEHAIGDYRRFSPLVRPGGLIVFDDYPNGGGVPGAIAELAAEGVVGVALTYNHRDGNSHYVIRK